MSLPHFLKSLNTHALLYHLDGLKRRLALVPRIKLRFSKGFSPEALERKAVALSALGRYENAIRFLKHAIRRTHREKHKSDRQKETASHHLTEEMFHVLSRQEQEARSLQTAGYYQRAELAFSETLALLGYIPPDAEIADRIQRRRKVLLDSLVYAIYMQARTAERQPEKAFELYERTLQLLKEDSIHWLEIQDAYDAFMEQHKEQVSQAALKARKALEELLDEVEYKPEEFDRTPDLADFELELIAFYAASCDFDKALTALEKLKPRLDAQTQSSFPLSRPAYESTLLLIADKMLGYATSLPIHRIDDKIAHMEKALRLFRSVSSPVEPVELDLADLYIQTDRADTIENARDILLRLRRYWELKLKERGARDTPLGGITELCRNLARVSRQLKLLGEDADETRYWEIYVKHKRRVFKQFIKARQADDTFKFYRQIARTRGRPLAEIDTDEEGDDEAEMNEIPA